MFASMFQCSSIAYQLICMLFSAIVICLTDVFLNAIDDETHYVDSLIQLPGYIMISFAIWYILQKRELKNFISEHKAVLRHY